MKSWTFTVGNFKFNPGDFAQPPPPVLGTRAQNGVLTVNVGSATRRNARNLQPGVIDEELVITRLGDGSQSGERVELTLFGVSQEFDNVTSIVADMDDGDDFVRIDENVASPMTIHLGSGIDQLDSSGVGALTVYGEDGDDSIVGGSGSDYLNGGNDADTIRGGPGQDTLLGGSGDDIIQWAVGDG